MEEMIILVDENDQEVGTGGKLQTHQTGKLHRAFSIFIFDHNDQLLLQKRAGAKYHSGNLWSNTCCGHPRPEESSLQAASRRLVEEMGIDCELKEAFTFKYRAEMDNSLIEHELDHVFLGRFNGDPIPNPNEVSEWRWVDLEWLRNELATHPFDFTYWLSISVERVESALGGLTAASSS